jgi:GT2 family glycosyltransferase
MKFAVVILNWRNAKATMRCASALLNNSIEDSNIYIVDNNSCDGSVEAFRDRFPFCHILDNTENSGYTGGNNIGLHAAFSDRHDAVLILNNDVEPRLSEAFASLVSDIFATNPNTLIGLPVHNEHGKPQFPQAAGTFMRALFQACGVDKMTPIICGCAMLVSRVSFERIGGLYENYFMYCEELDYMMRVAMAGGRVICPLELGYVVRDDAEERRPYVYYYQARNLIQLILLRARSRRFILTVSSVLIAIKQCIRSGKAVNVLYTFKGIIAALRGRTGQYPSAHS